jgi:hypothetical protein
VNLFLPGPFTSRAGLLLPFEIEAEALTPDDWAAIAEAVAPRLPAFGAAVGVPRGGIPLALAIGPYRQPRRETVLVCEDVWTSGGSWRKVAAEYAGKNVVGLVLFARGPLPPGVRAVFHEADWLTEGRITS